MKYYQGLFGCYIIVVSANNEIEAKKLIINKWLKYKDNSNKKEHIRPYIDKDFIIKEARRYKGFWI